MLGATRRGIARLGPDGTLDPTFDAGNVIAGTVYGLAVQDDGRIWLSDSAQPPISRILRLQTNGTLDNTYTSTNTIDGFIFALLPLPGGGVLVGTNPQDDGSKPALISLLPDGRFDTNFDAVLATNSTVFTLVREPDGHILVGGSLRQSGQAGSVPLLRMTSDLHWDNSFQADTFSAAAVVDSLLVQPDGKIVAGGYFFEVGGYWRRELVRLSSEGRVYPCFDPGLGLGGATPAGPVRCLLLQPDGRIVLEGFFEGIDEKGEQHNLARLLPQGPCDSIRVYLDVAGTSSTPRHFAAATFPPGGTNNLETSANLQDWHEVARDTAPYIYFDSPTPDGTIPAQFFRAHQEN